MINEIGHAQEKFHQDNLEHVCVVWAKSSSIIQHNSMLLLDQTNKWQAQILHSLTALVLT